MVGYLDLRVSVKHVLVPNLPIGSKMPSIPSPEPHLSFIIPTGLGRMRARHAEAYKTPQPRMATDLVSDPTNPSSSTMYHKL